MIDTLCTTDKQKALNYAILHNCSVFQRNEWGKSVDAFRAGKVVKKREKGNTFFADGKHFYNTKNIIWTEIVVGIVLSINLMTGQVYAF